MSEKPKKLPKPQNKIAKRPPIEHEPDHYDPSRRYTCGTPSGYDAEGHEIKQKNKHGKI